MPIFIEYDTHQGSYTSRHWAVFPTANQNEYVATYTGVLIVNFTSGVVSGGFARDRVTFTVPLDGLPPGSQAGAHSALQLRNWTVFIVPTALAGSPVRGIAVDNFGLQVSSPWHVDFDAYVFADLAVQDAGGDLISIAYNVQLIGQRIDSSAGKL
jgi:hypothetical protein